MEIDVDRIVQGFEDRTLPKPEWTHEAHVVVCWATLQRLDPAATLAHLQEAIPRYNEATGVANTDSGGYHETLTRYYVAAVAALAGQPIAAVLAHPSCSRTAPLDHWSRERLFSVTARRGYVEPDLAPLPVPRP